jgi:tRNA-specific 2-thiouridylase
MIDKINKPKVIVAMSGGVDSSVAAALLKKRGYDVVGVFFKLWKDLNESGHRGADADEKSARIVADKLGIELKIIDIRKEFKKTVVDYFLREYKAGRTPNPCAVCNPKIKFAALLKLAKKYRAVYVATGHYAQIFPLPLALPPLGRGGIREAKTREGYALYEAKDKTKDQSYFLYGLNQKQLAKIIFPLGDYQKAEVKEMARKMRLPVFDRKESHDVCFISGRTEDFLKKYLRFNRGRMVDKKDKVLGEHQGLPLYTVGQRKGINLGGPGPYYVIGKNIARNKLIITDKKKDSRLFQKRMTVEKINPINENLKFPLKAKVRIRYLHPAVRAIIKSRMNANEKANKREYLVEFKTPQRAVTPGQSAVFYGKRGEVLGGGIIGD